MLLGLLPTCCSPRTKTRATLSPQTLPHTEKEHCSPLRSLITKPYFKTANIIAKLYLLKAHVNYKVVTSKEAFCADTLNALITFLSLTQTAAKGCLCRTFLREAANLLCFHPLLKCSSHVWGEPRSWAWFVWPWFSALHQLLEQPWGKKRNNKTRTKKDTSCPTICISSAR